eukprot:369606_1
MIWINFLLTLLLSQSFLSKSVLSIKDRFLFTFWKLFPQCKCDLDIQYNNNVNNIYNIDIENIPTLYTNPIVYQGFESFDDNSDIDDHSKIISSYSNMQKEFLLNENICIDEKLLLVLINESKYLFKGSDVRKLSNVDQILALMVYINFPSLTKEMKNNENMFGHWINCLESIRGSLSKYSDGKNNLKGYGIFYGQRSFISKEPILFIDGNCCDLLHFLDKISYDKVPFGDIIILPITFQCPVTSFSLQWLTGKKIYLFSLSKFGFKSIYI